MIGGLSRKPSLDCTIEGLDQNGQPANETLPANAFDWYRGMGSATSDTVWSTIKYLKFGGLSRVFKVEIQTVDLARHDQALLMPLWSSALTADQIKKYRLPPMPVKMSDARADSFLEEHGDRAVELDALDPNLLQTTVRKAIVKNVNMRKWNAKLRETEELQMWIRGKLDDIERALDSEIESLS